MSANIESIQKDLRAAKLDGWLFYDFPAARGSHRPPHSGASRGPCEPAAGSILSLPRAPRKSWCTRSKPKSLAALPGRHFLYFSAQEELRGQSEKKIPRAVPGTWQCSIRPKAKNAIPYVSMVDAGTIELVRSTGVKVATSADLVQKYEACWSKAQLDSHLAAPAPRYRQDRSASFCVRRAIGPRKKRI